MLMDVYHGTWLPSIGAGFENQGQFIFSVERQAGNPGKSRKAQIAKHPNHLAKASELSKFLSTELSLTKVILNQLVPYLTTVYITLPCDNEYYCSGFSTRSNCAI